MEVAIIDWKNIDSRFVKDEMYELINAPKWVDFSAPDDPVDDEAWFCRPSCNHPKTDEDLFKEKAKTPTSNSKLHRLANVSEILPFGERNRRDATLKKRGTNPPVLLNKDTNYNRVFEDGENQNPNFSTPPNHKAKIKKEAVKTSTEKKRVDDTVMRKDQAPRLKSTLSARNLFSGGDLLNKVAEFCNELKKLATKVRDRDDEENVNGGSVEKQRVDDSGDFNDREKEKKPLLELNKDKMKVMETGNFKEKLRKMKRNDASENTPITVDVKNIKHKEKASLQIRTSPPTPQCFPANRGSSKAVTPQAFRSRPQGRGILQELQETNKEVNMDNQKINLGREIPVTTAEKEARTLNALWFLKPCTLSS